MITHLLRAACLAFLIWPLAVRAQSENDTRIRIRAVLHDPGHPTADLFVADAAGHIGKLVLNRGGLANAQEAQVRNGSLVLYKTAEVDPAKPAESVAASVKVTPQLKTAVLVIIGMPPESAVPYQLVLINDSPTEFAKGESCVLSIIPVESAIEAGEHKLQIKAGAVTRVPAVKKKDDYNMAQTNFFYKKNDSWTPFAERRLQYLDECRRIFIIHSTPKSRQPTVRTIIDTAPAVPSVKDTSSLSSQ